MGRPGLHTGLFGGNHIVVHGLAAGEQGDLGVGAALGKEGQRLLGVLFGHVLAVEDVDKLGTLLGVGLGQTAQQLIQLPVGAEELVLGESQVVPRLMAKPSKSESRAA